MLVLKKINNNVAICRAIIYALLVVILIIFVL